MGEPGAKASGLVGFVMVCLSASMSGWAMAGDGVRAASEELPLREKDWLAVGYLWFNGGCSGQESIAGECEKNVWATWAHERRLTANESGRRGSREAEKRSDGLWLKLRVLTYPSRPSVTPQNQSWRPCAVESRTPVSGFLTWISPSLS